jgi:hypothetical protein
MYRSVSNINNNSYSDISKIIVVFLLKSLVVFVKTITKLLFWSNFFKKVKKV